MQCRRDESKFAARQYFTRTFTRVTSGCTGIHCNKVYSALDFKFLKNNNFCMMSNYYKISLCQLQGVVNQLSKQPLTDSLATGTAGFKHCKHRRVETAGAGRPLVECSAASTRCRRSTEPALTCQTWFNAAHLHWSYCTPTDPTSHLLILQHTYWSYSTPSGPTAHLLHVKITTTVADWMILHVLSPQKYRRNSLEYRI